MKKFFSVVLLGLSLACSKDATVSPDPVPSPVAPSPSPSPIAPILFNLVDINLIVDGSVVQGLPAGQEAKLSGSLTTFDPTGLTVKSPPVERWDWANFSDPQAQCQVFGEVNTSHPHVQCNGAGSLIVQATAIGFDGQAIGISPLLVAPVF